MKRILSMFVCAPKVEYYMKKRSRKIPSVFLCLLVLAMVFAVAVPMNVSAADEVPFKGNFDGGNVPTGDPAWERIEVSGQASHLGKYTAVVDAYMPGGVIIGVDPDTGFPIVRLPTTATFTAANGDVLYADMDLVGMYHLIDLNFPAFELSATITGGTGHLEGATGSFSGSGGQITMPGEDTDLVRGTFAGTISTVGSNK